MMHLAGVALQMLSSLPHTGLYAIPESVYGATEDPCHDL